MTPLQKDIEELRDIAETMDREYGTWDGCNGDFIRDIAARIETAVAVLNEERGYWQSVRAIMILTGEGDPEQGATNKVYLSVEEE